jgi:hypothetical protein
MQDFKERRMSIEVVFWQYLQGILPSEKLLNKVIKMVWPNFTWQELSKAQLFKESELLESSPSNYPSKPKDFIDLENFLKEEFHSNAPFPFSAKLLVYCTFKACIRTAEGKVALLLGSQTSEEKGKLSSFARWGKALVLPMAEALIKAPGQDPVQTLAALATKKVQELRAAIAAATPSPSPSDVKESKTIAVTVFTSGPLIEAMNQATTEERPQSLVKETWVKHFITQFWRDVGVAWGKNYQKFEEEHSWLKPIVEKMFDSVMRSASGKQTVLFGKLSFLLRHVRQAYPDMGLTLVVGENNRYEIIPAPAYSGEAHHR